jgi:hypothetical protein
MDAHIGVGRGRTFGIDGNKVEFDSVAQEHLFRRAPFSCARTEQNVKVVKDAGTRAVHDQYGRKVVVTVVIEFAMGRSCQRDGAVLTCEHTVFKVNCLALDCEYGPARFGWIAGNTIGLAATLAGEGNDSGGGAE